MKKLTFAFAFVLVALHSFADLYLAGDSTMCNYADRQYPQQGWGKPLEIGNYDVTLRLGDAEKPTANFVKFMGRRLASDRIELAAGQFTKHK